MKPLTPKCMGLSISRSRQLTHAMNQILDDHTHVLYPRVLRRKAELSEGKSPKLANQLHVSVVGNSMGLHVKKVVRNKARRSVSQLFYDELGRRGFSPRGKPLLASQQPSSDDEPQSLEGPGWRSGTMTLCGTVNVLILEKFLHVSKEDVYQQVESLVSKIINQCRHV